MQALQASNFGEKTSGPDFLKKACPLWLDGLSFKRILLGEGMSIHKIHLGIPGVCI